MRHTPVGEAVSISIDVAANTGTVSGDGGADTIFVSNLINESSLVNIFGGDGADVIIIKTVGALRLGHHPQFALSGADANLATGSVANNARDCSGLADRFVRDAGSTALHCIRGALTLRTVAQDVI